MWSNEHPPSITLLNEKMRNKKQFCVYKKRKEKRKDVCLPLERLFLRVLQTYTYSGNERVARRVDGADRGLRERASFDVSFCLLISGKSLGSREARRQTTRLEIALSPKKRLKHAELEMCWSSRNISQGNRGFCIELNWSVAVKLTLLFLFVLICYFWWSWLRTGRFCCIASLFCVCVSRQIEIFKRLLLL